MLYTEGDRKIKKYKCEFRKEKENEE